MRFSLWLIFIIVASGYCLDNLSLNQSRYRIGDSVMIDLNLGSTSSDSLRIEISESFDSPGREISSYSITNGKLDLTSSKFIPGFQFLKIKDTQNLDDSLTAEFLMMSASLFELESPKSGALVEDIPTLKWNGPEGVQLWRWYLSDEPFSFDKDSILYEGSILKSGWSNSSQIDLSNTSQNSSTITPFIPGTRYYYAIFPAYAFNENTIDFNRVLLNSFKYLETNTTADSLILYHPIADTILDARTPNIEFFRWSKIESADYYILRILEKQREGSFEFETPLNEFFATDTLFAINLNELSLNGSLTFEVTAYGNNQQLSRVKVPLQVNQNAFNIQFPNAPTDLSIQALSSNSKTPRIYNLKLNQSLNLSEGLWVLNIQASGYENITLDLENVRDTSLTLDFRPYNAQLKMRLIDENNLPLLGNEVLITNLNTSKTASFFSSTGGYLEASLAPGSYLYSYVNERGIPSETTNFNLQDGSLLDLGEIVIRNQTLNWRGQLVDNQSEPLQSIGLNLFNQQGDFLFRTQTDNQGLLNLNLNVGSYKFTIDHPNLENRSFDIIIPQDSLDTYTVLPSLFQISGHVEIQSYITTDSLLTQRVPNYPIYAFSPNRDTLQLISNDQGEYRIQIADKENWTLGLIWNDSIIEVNNFNQETPNKNLIIQSKARILGEINGLSANDQVSVYATSSGKIFNGKILLGTNNQYLIEDLPSGQYDIEVQTSTSRGESTSPINVFKNISLNRYTQFDGPTINLSNDQRLTIFETTYQGQKLSSQINLTSPLSTQVQSLDSINLPQGLFQLNIIPRDLSIIPLSQLSFFRTDSLNDTLNYEFEDKHNAIAEQELIGNTFDSTYRIGLEFQTSPDSVRLFYQWGNDFWQSINADTVTETNAFFEIPIDREGDLTLQYYFKVYRGEKLFSNEIVGQKFRTRFFIAKNNWILQPLTNDTIFSPINTVSKIPLTIMNRKGQTQDISNFSIENITIQNSNSEFDISIDSISKILDIQTPRERDTTEIDLILFYRGDTLKYHKTWISKDLIAEELVIKVTPDKSFYSPGDTVHLESYLIEQGTGNQFYLNSEFSISHGAQTSQQLIVPSNFIGPIYFETTWQQLLNKSYIEVINTIPSNNSLRVLERDSNFQIVIAPNSNIASTATPIRLRPDLKDSITWASDEVNILEGPFALYLPLLSALDSIPQLQFKSPPSSDEIYFRLFNDSTFQFLDVDSSQISYTPIYNRVSNSKTTSKRFESNEEFFVWNMESRWPIFFDLSNADVQREEPYLTMTPNPFSPEIIAVNDGNSEPGTRIDFLPSAPQGQSAIVSIIIYNMAGEKIRTLAKQEVYEQTNQTLYWDGLTDSGRLARNGRYLVHFISGGINQKSKQKRILKTVVVFK